MHRQRMIRGLAGVSFLVLTLAAGCGGNSNNSMPTAPTPPTSGSGGSGGSGSGSGTTANVTITIAGMNGAQSYSPNPTTVQVGQTVAWRNGDSVTHTATANGGAFNTGNIAPGATSAPITMTSAGSFGYHCAIHPSMVGTVNVQ